MTVINDTVTPTPLDRFRIPALVVGVIALAILAFSATRNVDAFYRAWLIGFLFWFGVSIGSLGVLMLQYLTGGNWGVVMRRPLEAAARTLRLVALFLVPVLLGMHSLYEWTHAEAVAEDALLQHKTPYLNTPFFIGRTILYFAIWLTFVFLIERWARRYEETGDPWYALRLRGLSAGGLLVLGLTLTFASVDWMMSIEPHWFSTMYGISFVIGNLLTGFAFTIVMVVAMAGSEPLSRVAKPMSFRDFGNLQLAFIMLWAYTAFSQFMLIWYGNLQEETPYYLRRMSGGWGAVAAILIVFHFFLPFVFLLMRGIKDRPRTLGAVSLLILVMRVLDLRWLISPAFEKSFHFDWRISAAVIGLGGIWFALYTRFLRSKSLVPMSEPYVQKALGEAKH